MSKTYNDYEFDDTDMNKKPIKLAIWYFISLIALIGFYIVATITIKS